MTGSARRGAEIAPAYGYIVDASLGVVTPAGVRELSYCAHGTPDLSPSDG